MTTEAFVPTPKQNPTRVDRVAQRHAAIYADEGIPRFQIWRVAERLLGGRHPLSEADVLQLRAEGVTHVLDLREDREWEAPGRHGREALDAIARLGVRRKQVPMPDGQAPESAALRAAADWLDTVLAARDAVAFVHCRAGIERTATALATWLARRDCVDFESALARLRQRGYPGDPLGRQVAAAKLFLRKTAR